MIVCDIHILNGLMLIPSSLSEITYHEHHSYHVDTFHSTDAKI
jgi:hypothetical protein